MIGLVLVTHGKLAVEFRAALEHVVGPQAQIETVSIGPDDDVEIPRGSVKTDWEVELGVVIGKPAKYVSEADALAHVAGYCVVNDLSERDFQLHRSGQWVKGKSHDTFGPIGPWLVTADEIADPQRLSMWLEVNGTRYQDGSTATMHFGVAQLISHLSQFMSLLPGDITSTGTPPPTGSAGPLSQSLAHASALRAFHDGSLTSQPAAPRSASKTMIPVRPSMTLGVAGIQKDLGVP